IAMVVTVIGFVLVLARSKKSVIYSLLISVGVMVAIYFAIGYSAGFRNFLLEIFKKSNPITFKINDIYNSFWGLGDAHNVEVRADAYTMSLKVIFTYPILGGFGSVPVGGHSAILDTIAIFGWFGGYAFITMILHVPAFQKRTSKDDYVKKVANSVTATILLVGLLDTFPYQLAMAVTVVALGLFKDIIRWRQEL
ncbi:MAG: hypothetical protein J5836_02835, partial [Clostridia bacterium]|nr:hypothetical protein [Clostridia bacterium]